MVLAVSLNSWWKKLQGLLLLLSSNGGCGSWFYLGWLPRYGSSLEEESNVGSVYRGSMILTLLPLHVFEDVQLNTWPVNHVLRNLTWVPRPPSSKTSWRLLDPVLKFLLVVHPPFTLEFILEREDRISHTHFPLQPWKVSVLSESGNLERNASYL